jgi:YhcH/YjgK/YiaL family protein
MILDSLNNLKKYTIIPHIDCVLDFINTHDLSTLPEGDTHLKGDDLIVKVLKYYPNKSSEIYFETHKFHTDIQIVVKGIEVMQTVSPQHLTITDEFKLEGDFIFYKASENISTFVVSKNEFAIFLTGEPHKPGCRYNHSNEMISKVVFKVKNPLK